MTSRAQEATTAISIGDDKGTPSKLSNETTTPTAAATTPTTTTTNSNRPTRTPVGQQQSCSMVQQSSVTSMASGGGGGKQQSSETISFHLKSGIFTRRVTLDTDKMALGLLKQLAVAFLDEIYFQHSYPSQSYIGDYLRRHFATSDSLSNLYERILLRLYTPAQDTFVPFYSVSDIKPESYISIEISERQQVTTLGGGPHAASVVISEGDGRSSGTAADQLTPAQHLLTHSHSHALSSSSSNYQLKISHDFHSTTYIKPTYCASCNTLILGVYKQGFQCNHCRRNYCPKCKNKAEAAGEGCLAPAPSTNSGATTPSSASTSSSLLLASASNLLSPKQQPQLQSPMKQTGNQQQQQQTIVSNSSGDSGASSSSSSSISPSGGGQAGALNGAGSPQPKSEKLEIMGPAAHANMSKRKSASNLLHFNIANPFKSHHAGSSQAGQQHANCQSRDESPGHTRAPSMKAMRGSAGALDPILQQLSRQMRDNQQQQQQQQQQSKQLVAAAAAEVEHQHHQQHHHQAKTSGLLNVQTAQLSSSHQNLYTISDRELETPSPAVSGAVSGSSSAHQSPNKQLASSVKQLSNSARHSARDLNQATSPTRRDQAVSNHAFIGMDWIQLYGEPACGVCTKPLKSRASGQQSSPAPLSMCKTCKLQVHAQCQDLALADCLSRIAESSRAAAERSDSKSPNGDAQAPVANTQAGDDPAGGDKAALRSTNSNVSRDNIRLHRLGQSVKHMKRPDLTKPIIEGWLQHKTLSDEQPRRHYWRLDETDITLYESDTSPRYFKAIALSKITRVISASSLPKQIKEDVALGCSPTKPAAGGGGGGGSKPTNSPQQQQQQQGQTKSANTSPLRTVEFKAQMESMFAFEVTTGSVYLVQASDQVEANRWKGSLEAITGGKKRVVETKTPQDENKAPSVAGHQHQFRPQQSEVDKDNAQQQQQQQQQQLKQQQEQQQPQATQQQQQQQKDLIDLTDKPQEEKQKGASTPARHHHHHHHHHHHAPTSASQRNQQKSYTDPNRSRLYNRPRKVIKLDPMSIPDHWIEGKYLIERNRVKGVGFEELGSGQFGKVYAAVSEIKAEDTSKGLWSGVPVAIKEISKARFDLRQQAKLKNEANILSRLDHPGVIILERVHDLPDKLYIVMEQLEDDMLEMIVSTEEKRLSERVTKFLTYQILEALKYLHSQNIAHCDLKPENVLLCEQRSQFPQIKLCDFGFAKIIEENSFRSSLVGTPAYLAPEVVKGERYNRSVDLWSVGVIVYVSLSGEFPFNEGENIHDQISRANFMYPDQPWAKISAQAKSFINSLLRVNSDKRLSASRAQMDAWLQDYQLWCDLCELELRLGRRWVTDDADFGRWSQYAKQRQLQVPRAALQLHQELASSNEEG